ncbi:hypothetical protein FF100_05960 [Methylobacterium terricola]|uniref:Putative Flp pilus-assembly TadG-like N-terminal domain-containing protein n=1 Tax=Methylobacterium terricola TaxID=2583531 RepID=A0A5C4LKS6_9HYPH|nr:pilus assembly protein TadG-related protein [Methylobacterium terricola]TNC15107.1 hypothetical protein FF100_05960 [Methylobacterium terricola]
MIGRGAGGGSRFWADRSGSIVVIFGLLGPVLLGMVGLAVDYATWTMQRTTLQQAADAAALAVISDLQVSGANALRMQSLAESYAKSNVKLQRGDGAVKVTVTPVIRERPGGHFIPIDASRGRTPNAVTVTLSQRKFAIMRRLVTPYLTDLSLSATAETVGTTKLCIVALSRTGLGALQLYNWARIEAGDCAVYAMSSDVRGLVGGGASLLQASTTCAVGGFWGQSANFSPLPVSGCPAIKDPLAERPAPPVGSCLQNNLILSGGRYTLDPGTYCGGLMIKDGAEVRLRPGIFVMKDGPLVVGPPQQMAMIEEVCEIASGIKQCRNVSKIKAIGSLKGDDVGIYFTGNYTNSQIKSIGPLVFLPNSAVELTAPRTGPMAGVMLFEDRSTMEGQQYVIMSDSARRLVGTIYLPRGTFWVRSSQVVADQSEYTAIVANKIRLDYQPRLVINTRYGATDGPVPTGLGPSSSVVGLAR